MYQTQDAVCLHVCDWKRTLCRFTYSALEYIFVAIRYIYYKIHVDVSKTQYYVNTQSESKQLHLHVHEHVRVDCLHETECQSWRAPTGGGRDD